MPMIGHHPTRACRGFTLLEVLVALVVLSVGLLGLSGLQTTSLRNNHSAFLRSQATLVVDQILDSMRTNRAEALAEGYDIAYEVGATPRDCSGGCTAAEYADMDVADWRAQVGRLPGGQGAIDVDGDGIATISIRWTDTRDSDNKLELITKTQL